MNQATADSTDPVHLGPRPFYLVDQLEEGELKATLQGCAATTLQYDRRNFSIAHRGASLQFPEHTQEAYLAAHRMGAGIIECDVTFTSDAELVCRHAQCDLHTTSNILSTPLAEKCSVPFTPAQYDDAGELLEPADARCCASDLTLAEFKSLQGKMDAADRTATTVEEYMGGTANFRTDLYATGGTLMSHQDSISELYACAATAVATEHLVAFSCKRRGFCTSCGARRLRFWWIMSCHTDLSVNGYSVSRIRCVSCWLVKRKRWARYWPLLTARSQHT